MYKILSFIVCVFFLFSCDLDHKKKCEWYLVPDEDRVKDGSMDESIDEGFIPVCARNYKSRKQDCRLQTTLEYAQSHYKQLFRYVDLKVKNPGIPRTVEQIDFDRCKNVKE